MGNALRLGFFLSIGFGLAASASERLSAQEIAPIDGSHHNLADPAANQAGTAEKRYLENDYPDDRGEILAGRDRPGAREISNAVFAQSDNPVPNTHMHNNLLW